MSRPRKEVFPVNPIFGAIPPSHPAADAFHNVPRLGTGTLLLTFLPVISTTSVALAAFVWLALHPATLIPPNLFPPLIGVTLAWIAMLLGGTYLGLVSQRKRVLELDQDRLGLPKPDETRVGIAYAEGVWTLRDDAAWDRGYLSASPDGLRFRGHCSEFALPAHAVRSIRLETSRMAQHRSVPRLFVDWTSPDGEENTLSLDTRPFLLRESVEGSVEHLRDEIQNVLRLPSGSPLSPIWPPAVRLNRLDLRPSQARLTTRDFLSVIALSIGFGILVLVAITVILAVLPIEESLRGTLQKIFGYVAPQVPGICGVAFLTLRVRKKLTALPELSHALDDPLPQASPVEEVRAEPLKPRS